MHEIPTAGRSIHYAVKKDSAKFTNHKAGAMISTPDNLVLEVKAMKFTQIRHATCIIDFAGQSFAVDPILYGKHTLEPVKGGIDRKNPFVDLPVSKEHIRNVDAILLTHTHRDHFDPEIIHLYGSNIPIICSGEYHKHLMELGFTNIKPIVKDGSILFLSLIHI